MTIDSKDAFLHLIYDYRYLAQAGGAWRIYGPPGASEDQKAANMLLPGIGVTVLDSLLLHARSLIDFYTKPATGPGRRSTDILLPDFDNLVINPIVQTNLMNYKKPVEVHVLHLTAWRDATHRLGSVTHARPDWNIEATPLVSLLLDALLDATSQAANAGSNWDRPFGDLLSAATTLLNNHTFTWPVNLTEKSNVTSYLTAQGL